MKNPLVSILINNYNYARYLDDAIQSALSQSYKTIEIIVVDDGSTDNSREVLSKYEGKITVFFKSNGGQASAFNMGVANSKGEIICFLDADDTFALNKVEKIVETFNNLPDIDWCFDKVVHCNESMHILSNENRSEKTFYSDHRQQIAKGSLKKHLAMEIPATSGLSFKTSLLAKIFPIPESESCSMCENYMKYIGVGIGKGAFLDMSLTMQRIHGNNLFTRVDRDSSMTARISLLTGYWLNRNFPQLGKFADTQIAVGLSAMKYGTKLDAKYYELIREYFQAKGSITTVSIKLRSFYYDLQKLIKPKPHVRF
jgi:glycosyltransferase involved in cell wall biosynthesis